ncbi:MAG: YqjF family protein [Bryobacteraceae bacterium]
MAPPGGLTPFLLKGLRPPFAPALPWISHFPEMNIRTYVRGPDGEPGVWFFTLEAGRLAAVAGARLAYRLPYRWAAMRVNKGNGAVEYSSSGKWPFGTGDARIRVEIGEPIQSAELDRFLTARFRLYILLFGRLGFAQIEHKPWPLRTARLVRLGQNVIEASGVPQPQGDPMLHHSPGVNVRVGDGKGTPLSLDYSIPTT